VLFDEDVSEEQVICKTCLTLQNNVQKQQLRKERQYSAPAKVKPPWQHVVLKSFAQQL
jgi:hypothetical protein